METAIRLCRPFAAIDCGEFVAASFHVSHTTRDEMCPSNRDCKCRLSDLSVPPSPPSAQDRCSVWLSDTERQSWWKCAQVWKRNLWLSTRAAGLQSSLSEVLHLCSHSQLVWGSGKGTSMILNNQSAPLQLLTRPTHQSWVTQRSLRWCGTKECEWWDETVLFLKFRERHDWKRTSSSYLPIISSPHYKVDISKMALSSNAVFILNVFITIVDTQWCKF